VCKKCKGRTNYRSQAQLSKVQPKADGGARFARQRGLKIERLPQASGLAMDQPAPGRKQPIDSAEELRKEAVKVQEKLKGLLKEISDIIEKTRQVGKSLPPEQSR
jgi:hypothetical protein